ncbi:S-adenosyl-L-methionine-dependent methyltransferase [Dendryphion nanum]|uniref:S-adenosyl-L-methionine-dependent methyltransferase n=1 Tax=Dendryphion nanum TaxID=256645 RepID=A0A9P9CXL0_9PLEO|nr:S-adenosyl-L-methionine-dependent methyltransferase [Dendryphion nanum]
MDLVLSGLPARSEHCTAVAASLEQPNNELWKLLSKISTCIAAGQRKEAIDATERLHDAMELPEERIFRIMAMPSDATALGLAIDMKLFDIAVRHMDSTGKAIALSELATLSGSDPNLLLRIVRFLLGHGLFTEVAAQCYQATELGRSLVNNQPMGAVVLAMSTNESFFEWLEGRPEEKKAFHLSMSGVRPNVVCQWFYHYPVEERLEAAGDRVALVDVGGGMGHDSKRLLERYPSLRDKLQVLDLPKVVMQAPAYAGIQFVGHDFFDLYPDTVRGANTYYMRMILHDWPEKQARSILANVREAMSEDSVLLINESVLPEQRVSMYEARMDFLMMAYCASMERTESQWKKLLQGSGFVIRRIWTCGPMSLIEAVLDTV